jgi:hypothetical protein
MKKAGFNQGIYQISETRKEELGTLRILSDGRKFRYARAGSSALAAGKLGVAADIAAAHANEAILTVIAIGTKVLALTVTAGTVIAENELKGGAFQVNDATGEGYSYVIDANTALAVGGTTINVTIEEGIKVALDTTSEFTLVHNPWNDVVEGTTLGMAIGVPVVAVTAAYYYWAQTGGLAVGLMGGTVALGSALMQDNAGVAGAMIIMTAGSVIPTIGVVHGFAGVDTEYQPIFLMID